MPQHWSSYSGAPITWRTPLVGAAGGAPPTGGGGGGVLGTAGAGGAGGGTGAGRPGAAPSAGDAFVGGSAGGVTGANVLRPLTDDLRAYYTTEDPSAYFRQYSGALADPNGNRGRYLQSKFSQAFADYLRAAEGNDQLLFPDFLTAQYGQGLLRGFDTLGWRDRGEAAPSLGAGRIVW